MPQFWREIVRVPFSTSDPRIAEECVSAQNDSDEEGQDKAHQEITGNPEHARRWWATGLPESRTYRLWSQWIDATPLARVVVSR